MTKPDDAENIFLRMVVSKVVDATTSGMKTLLQEGPSGRLKDPRGLAQQNWFLNLEEEEKELVIELVQETVIRTVFNLLVVLDNKVGYPIEDEVSDLALNLQKYEAQEDLFAYVPKEVTRINRSYSPDGDLHEKIMEFIQKRQK